MNWFLEILLDILASGFAFSPAPGGWTMVEGTGGFMTASAFGEGFVCLRHAGMAVEILHPDGLVEELSRVDEAGVEWLSEPEVQGAMAGFLQGAGGGSRLLMADTAGTMTEHRRDESGTLGRPAWSPDGRLLYTLDGRVYMDGEETALECDAFLLTPSPSGESVAWSGGSNELLVGRIDDGSTASFDLPAAVLRPVWMDEGRLLVPVSDGTIWMLDRPDASLERFGGTGEIAWNGRMALGVVIESSDDGHMITGSRSFLVAANGLRAPVGVPAGTAPVSPRSAPWGFTAVDAFTGAVMVLRVDSAVCE